MTRVSSLAGLAVAATVLLTGCGSVPALDPGVGVRVDGTTYSMGEVEELSSTYCQALETQLQEGELVASSLVSGQVAGSIALRTAAEQFADETGVEPDPSYGQVQEQLESSIADLSPAQQDAVRQVNLAGPYTQAIQIAAGKEGGATDDQAALSAGQEAFADWLQAQEVRIDPRFSVSIDDGQLVPVDTSVSYSVSKTALSGTAPEPDAAYAAGLPQTQRCG